LVLESKKAKRLILVLSALFFIYAIVDFLTSKSNSFDSIPTGIECILIILYSLYYLYEKITKTDTLFIYNTSNFWIVVAIIIYFSGTFFLFIYSQSFINDQQFLKTYALILGIFTIVRNLMLAIAFIIKPSKSNAPVILPRKTSY
jgi:hypothetical protein